MARVMLVGALAAMALTLAPTLPVAATTYVEVKMKCPIGKETFKADQVGSYTTFGQRPDGKPYGTLSVVPIPECPSNGFPMFEETFSKEAIAVLTPIVTGAAFQASRQSETQHYRVWMLQKALGVPLTRQAFSLMVAGWETDSDAVRKARYQSEFVALIDSIDRTANQDDWFWLNLRAANALRELGRFDEALQRFDQVLPHIAAQEDEDVRNEAGPYIELLKQATREQNRSAEPVGIVPDDAGAFRCVLETADLAPSEGAICSGDSMTKLIAELEIDTGSGPVKGADAVRAIHQRNQAVPDVE